MEGKEQRGVARGLRLRLGRTACVLPDGACGVQLLLLRISLARRIHRRSPRVIASPWLFAWANRSDLTIRHVHWLARHRYSIRPDGVPGNDDGPPDLAKLGMSDSESCNNGVLLTVDVNSKRTEKLWVDKSSDEIDFAPYPICPHETPFQIMLHRTIGKLRKPLLK